MKIRRAKYLSFVAAFIVLLFLFITVNSYCRISEQMRKNQNNTQSVVDSGENSLPSTTSELVYKSFYPIFSADKSLFVLLGAKGRPNEVYEFSYSVYDWEGNRFIETDYDPPRHVLLRTTPSLNNPYYSKIYSDDTFLISDPLDELSTGIWEHLVAVSKTGSKVAILDQDKIALFESSPANEIMKRTQEITRFEYSRQSDLELSDLGDNLFDFFYTDDESLLILVVGSINESRIYSFSEELGLVLHDVEGTGFTYVPNSNKIAYFEGVEGVSGAYTINYYNPNSKQVTEYKIPGQGEDGVGNLEISPNQAMVCFEHSSSGFHGYSIYRLSDMLEMGSGGQYSFCEHWIDNTSVIVRYKPYNNPSRVTHKRIFDVVTGEFEFVSVENYMYIPH